MVYTFNPGTQEADKSEFEASLVFIVSSRPKLRSEMKSKQIKFKGLRTKSQTWETEAEGLL